MDLTAVSLGLSSLQSAIDLTKAISSASGAVEKAELKLKLAELLTALADAKISMSEAGSRISDLETQLQQRTVHDAQETWFADGVYVLVDDLGKSTDGPFCARCFDIDYRLVRPANDRQGERGMGYCPQCKNRYPLWNAEKKLNDDGVKSGFTG